VSQVMVCAVVSCPAKRISIMFPNWSLRFIPSSDAACKHELASPQVHSEMVSIPSEMVSTHSETVSTHSAWADPYRWVSTHVQTSANTHVCRPTPTLVGQHPRWLVSIHTG
jgi:hypothetical protein